MSTSILFLCPHNVAKSLIATSYAGRLAGEEGLDWQISSAGTEPEESVPTHVTAFLSQEGFDVSHHRPRQVTPQDVAHADLVVSIGCDIQGLGVDERRYRDWSDVPPVYAGIAQSRDAIVEHLHALIAELNRAGGSPPQAASR